MDAWSKDVVAQQGPLLFSLTFKFSLWGPQPRVKMPGLRSSLSSQGMKALVVMVASSLRRVPWLRRPATPCLGRPPPVFVPGASASRLHGRGPRGQLQGGAPGGLQSSCSSLRPQLQALPPPGPPCKGDSDLPGGSKMTSLLTSVHRTPSWVPFTPRISAQA